MFGIRTWGHWVAETDTFNYGANTASELFGGTAFSRLAIVKSFGLNLVSRHSNQCDLIWRIFATLTQH